MLSEEDIDTLFTYHNPVNVDPISFEEIRNTAKVLGKIILKHSKNDKDMARSLNKLRESIYYAIASIVVPEVEL